MITLTAPTILFFHQIVEKPRRDHHFLSQALTPAEFRAALQSLAARYRVIGVDTYERGWRGEERWPSDSVVITFDDGFRNNVIAAEILAELKLPATFFVLSDVIDTDFVPWYMRWANILSTRRRGRAWVSTLGEIDLENKLAARQFLRFAKERLLWMDVHVRDATLAETAEALGAAPYDLGDPDLQYFRTADLRRVRDLGITVASHGATHDNLVRCNDAELTHEISGSKARLERALDAPVDYLSYPDGRHDRRVVDAASKSYRMAFAATPFIAERDPYRVPRRASGPDAMKVSKPTFLIERVVKDAAKAVMRA